jgi:predicted phage terminase large subunit-like protein
MLKARFDKSGYISTLREYFHKHIIKGMYFKNEHIIFEDALPLDRYDELITYCDSSISDTGDFKAIVLIGRKGIKYTILDVFCRQCSRSAMVQAHYDMWYKVRAANAVAKHFVEMNSLQIGLMQDYTDEGLNQNVMMPIAGDDRKKPKKTSRIEGLEPLFSRKLITFATRLKKDKDTKALIDQLMAFPSGHDDGPDALEGGIFLMVNSAREGTYKPRQGKYRYSKARG